VADEHSFDVVSKVDLQEVDNAYQQAIKELANRYDFRGTKASIEFDKTKGLLTLIADDEFKRQALEEILLARLAKRGIPSNAFEKGTPDAAFQGTLRQVFTARQGLPVDKAKELAKAVRDSKQKVSAAIQGDQLRVSGKSKDTLQETMALLRTVDIALPIQFTNFR